MCKKVKCYIRRFYSLLYIKGNRNYLNAYLDQLEKIVLVSSIANDTNFFQVLVLVLRLFAPGCHGSIPEEKFDTYLN